jgi:hypothetical protein
MKELSNCLRRDLVDVRIADHPAELMKHSPGALEAHAQ